MTAQTKKCSLCAETIQLAATTCEYCGAMFEVLSNGYCRNCHTVKEADESGHCRTCGGEVIDWHVESKFIEEQAAPPASTAAPAVPPPIPPPGSSTNFEGIVKGYCDSKHGVVEADENGRCPKCGGELSDKHIESTSIGKGSPLPKPGVPPRPAAAPIQAVTAPVQSSASLPRSAPAPVQQPPPQPISPSQKTVRVKIEVITGLCGNTRYNGVYDFTLPLDLEASQLLNRIAADIGVTIGFSTQWCLQCKNGYLLAEPGGGKLQTLRQAGVQDGDILPFWDE